MSDFLATLPSLQAYLLVAAMLFCIGVWGLINSRNAVRVLMSIELMLNAVNINLKAFSSFVDGDLIRGHQEVGLQGRKRGKEIAHQSARFISRGVRAFSIRP